MTTWTPLSGLDALFLHLESPRTPMHAGSVAIFEGAPLRDRHGLLRIAAARAAIEQRLYLVPKLRQRVRFSYLGEAAPVWVDDAEFDIAFHVRHVAIPAPGTETELAELCAELLEAPLDRERPLWEMWFVEGLCGGEVAVVEKTHHALADGLGGVELATVLLDLQRRHPPPHFAPRPWHPNPEPLEGTVVGHELIRRSVWPFRLGLGAVGALRHPVGSLRRTMELIEGFGSLARPGNVAPRSSINLPVGHGRRVAFVRQPIDQLRRVEHRFGTTLNDVLLAAVAGGLRLLFLERGEAAPATLKVLVPVGTDHRNDRRLGNRVSGMLVGLPLATADPVARLQAVAHEVSGCKRHRQSAAAALLVDMLDLLPQSALSSVTRLVNRQPFVNLVVTNVPGPPAPLYAMGARMLEAFPFVPLAGNLSLGVAALSYAGQLSVGLVADRDRCADLDVLAAGIRRSFAELVVAADALGADASASERARGGPAGRHRPSSARRSGQRKAAGVAARMVDIQVGGGGRQ